MKHRFHPHLQFHNYQTPQIHLVHTPFPDPQFQIPLIPSIYHAHHHENQDFHYHQYKNHIHHLGFDAF